MSSANSGECVTTGELYRPTHQWGGGGGGGSMFQEVGGLYGVSESGGVS